MPSGRISFTPTDTTGGACPAASPPPSAPIFSTRLSTGQQSGLVVALLTDSSPYALRPIDPAVLTADCAAIDQFVALEPAQSTRRSAGRRGAVVALASSLRNAAGRTLALRRRREPRYRPARPAPRVHPDGQLPRRGRLRHQAAPFHRRRRQTAEHHGQSRRRKTPTQAQGFPDGTEQRGRQSLERHGVLLRREIRSRGASLKPQRAVPTLRGARAGLTARQHTTRQLPARLVLARRHSAASALTDRDPVPRASEKTKSRRASTAISTSRTTISASSSTTSSSEIPPSLSCRACPQATSPLFAPRLRNATRLHSTGATTRLTSLSSTVPKSTPFAPCACNLTVVRPPSHRQHASDDTSLR